MGHDLLFGFFPTTMTAWKFTKSNLTDLHMPCSVFISVIGWPWIQDDYRLTPVISFHPQYVVWGYSPATFLMFLRPSASQMCFNMFKHLFFLALKWFLCGHLIFLLVAFPPGWRWAEHQRERRRCCSNQTLKPLFWWRGGAMWFFGKLQLIVINSSTVWVYRS